MENMYSNTYRGYEFPQLIAYSFKGTLIVGALGETQRLKHTCVTRLFRWIAW